MTTAVEEMNELLRRAGVAYISFPVEQTKYRCDN